MNEENNSNDEEQRQQTDRRQEPTPFLSRHTFRGRRRQARRTEEQENYYVDRIHPTMYKYLWGLLGLALIDGLATLYEVYRLGATEANPIMASLLNIGEAWFLVIKYSVTVVALLVLLLHQFFRHVQLILSGLLLFYLAIVIYHGVILVSHFSSL